MLIYFLGDPIYQFHGIPAFHWKYDESSLKLNFNYWYVPFEISPLVNWNTSKGNQAHIQKFESPNQKMPKSKHFLTSVKN